MNSTHISHPEFIIQHPFAKNPPPIFIIFHISSDSSSPKKSIPQHNIIGNFLNFQTTIPPKQHLTHQHNSLPTSFCQIFHFNRGSLSLGIPNSKFIKQSSHIFQSQLLNFNSTIEIPPQYVPTFNSNSKIKVLECQQFPTNSQTTCQIECICHSQLFHTSHCLAQAQAQLIIEFPQVTSPLSPHSENFHPTLKIPTKSTSIPKFQSHQTNTKSKIPFKTFPTKFKIHRISKKSNFTQLSNQPPQCEFHFTSPPNLFPKNQSFQNPIPHNFPISTISPPHPRIHPNQKFIKKNFPTPPSNFNPHPPKNFQISIHINPINSFQKKTQHPPFISKNPNIAQFNTHTQNPA